MVLATAVLYAFGTAWYCVQAEVDLQKALAVCVIPFIPFDLIKMALAGAHGGNTVYHKITSWMEMGQNLPPSL